MGLLEGKRAVVTGGARGIGLAIARSYLAHGASVIVADVDGEAAERVAAELARTDPRVESPGAPTTTSASQLDTPDAARRPGTSDRAVLAVRCDVTDEAAVEAVVGRCVGEFGGIDVMVNNAGITRDRMMHRMDLDAFREVVDVHLTGTWLGTRAAGRVMREAGQGAIINLSSMSGRIGNAGQSNYSSAKAGIVGLTKSAAKELGPKGVRVNAIAPGLIRTPMTEAMPEDVLADRIAAIPLGRMGEPEEVADAAVYLASDLASYVTGTVVEVAGGRGG